MATINISKKSIEERDGVVILPAAEYRRLISASIPTYQLTGKAARDLDKEYDRAWANYRAGKTISAPSLSAAVAMYKKRRVRTHAR